MYEQEKITPYHEGEKASQVEQMFDNIAPTYDKLNHRLSWDIDKGWRKKAIKALAPYQPQSLLDIATGTGDFAILAAQMLRPQKLVGADISEGMMEIGRQKVKALALDNVVTFEKEDCLNLSYQSDTFDAVTAAFGIRNFADLDAGLREMYRVLKPGGHLSIIELTTPVTFPMKQLFHIYSHTVLPIYGRMISRDTSAYSYLTKTIEAFPQGERMMDILMKAGFAEASFKRLTFGICTMDIEGTAGAPTVTFGLDMPTLNADAQQMILSVMNSEEDMNQQVFYLLAVGRFMPQGTNNANQESTTQQSQTSLAMQSILSGTISQQINAVLSNVVKSNNWNFGANISTGDEGFNNAEYEGLLSGRLLDNRLLINGEFGYRDNVNTENKSSFIGDFDVQYLLHPNGNLAVKVYNQTNDRYFTRNTLTTQGVGLIVKKDFTNIRDLFRSNRKKGKKKDTHPSKEGYSVKSTEQH